MNIVIAMDWGLTSEKKIMVFARYKVALISSRCALHRLRRSIRFPSIFGFLIIFCRKTQRTHAKSGRPKVADWKDAMWKKFTGRLVSKWERTGRNGPILQTHTRVSYSSIDAVLSGQTLSASIVWQWHDEVPWDPQRLPTLIRTYPLVLWSK